MMEIYGLNGGLSKQFTVVVKIVGTCMIPWMLQFVVGSGPMLPKNLTS